MTAIANPDRKRPRGVRYGLVEIARRPMRLAEQPQGEVNHEDFLASRLEKPKSLERMKKMQR